ncbi:hypothetical protein Dimus_025684 [Dionaea muscipula]
MFPVVYPVLVPGLVSNLNHEQEGHGAGIYAVPALPFGVPVAGISTNALIPLTYRVSTRSSTLEARAEGAEQIQVGQQLPQQLPHQRQMVVRRFHIEIHLDLLLILKLAAVIFLFNQDGSRQRLVVLVFLASIVYLYQTGALAPLLRWISQAMHRAAAPPRAARPAARPNPALRPENENIAAAEGEHGGEGNNQPPGENEAAPEAGNNGGANQWWGIVKEIQMIVFGFITSLLPGFHNLDHP